MAGVIVAVIVDRPTCLECVTAKSGITSVEAVRLISHVGTHLALRIEQGRCRACGNDPVGLYSLARPG